MSDKILLQNMMFFGRHGVYDYEREHGQRFYIDAELTVSLEKAAKTDDLTTSVDYVTAYHKIKDIVETQKFNLLEALAGKIAEALLVSPVNQVCVRVRKPGVPLPGQIDYVQVEITRSVDQ